MATQVLYKNFYVNLLSGTMNLQRDVRIDPNLGFTPRKWAPNHPTFLGAIPE